jgi:hypothetical protein
LAHVISAAQLNLTPGPTLNHLVDIPGDAIYVAGPRNGMAFPLMIHFKTIDAMTVKDDNGQIIFNRCPGLKVFLNNATDWRLYKFCCGFERFYVSWIQQSQVFDGDLVIHVFPKGVVEMFAGTTG